MLSNFINIVDRHALVRVPYTGCPKNRAPFKKIMLFLRKMLVKLSHIWHYLWILLMIICNEEFRLYNMQRYCS